MIIHQLTANSALWPAYVDHLKQIGEAPMALGTGDQPRTNVYYLVALDGEQIIGSLSMRLQPIIQPAKPRIFG